MGNPRSELYAARYGLVMHLFVAIVYLGILNEPTDVIDKLKGDRGSNGDERG